MSDDLRHIRRYELKYLINEQMASAIRHHISGICRPDPNTDPVNHTYIVNNLYFDTPSLTFYHDTRFKKETRFKPRARYYGHHLDTIYPELKFKSNSIVWKQRQPIPREKWRSLFHPDQSRRTEPIFKPKLDSFEDVIHLYNAQPILQVRYEREAYITELEKYGRITFDRKLTSRLSHGSLDFDLDHDYIYYDDPQTIRAQESFVILEIKVETNVPGWVIRLIEMFDLQQTGFSKYCNGIECHLGYAAKPHRVY